ncbi:unnamed protein product [Strongylus vulgaris]|uniref:Uncharacterized protein n=1 Tax=Strongylus vulgaris TaxID=40348 RepID=A0A3P7KF24_STRVU|nr:unnamed protein product [Strongylus vulgaris]
MTKSSNRGANVAVRNKAVEATPLQLPSDKAKNQRMPKNENKSALVCQPTQAPSPESSGKRDELKKAVRYAALNELLLQDTGADQTKPSGEGKRVRKRMSLLARLRPSRMLMGGPKEKAKAADTRKESNQQVGNDKEEVRKRCSMGGKISAEEESDTLKGVTSIDNEEEKSKNAKLAVMPQAEAQACLVK